MGMDNGFGGFSDYMRGISNPEAITMAKTNEGPDVFSADNYKPATPFGSLIPINLEMLFPEKLTNVAAYEVGILPANIRYMEGFHGMGTVETSKGIKNLIIADMGSRAAILALISNCAAQYCPERVKDGILLKEFKQPNQGGLEVVMNSS